MRHALHSRIVSGREDAYDRAHIAIPAGLVASFGRFGIESWTIWRSGRELFHVVEADDLDAAFRALADDPADIEWQKSIGLFVEGFVHSPNDPASLRLFEVWDLRSQIESRSEAADDGRIHSSQ